MALVVVGSVAYDGVETPHGKVDRMLGGAATYIALAASYFTPVRIVAVVGDDFAPEDEALLASRDIDLSGMERVAGGKTFFWSGVYSADMNDRTTTADGSQRLRRFQSAASRIVPLRAVPAAGQHPAVAATERAGADARAANWPAATP